jgi:hypothetical protein
MSIVKKLRDGKNRQTSGRTFRPSVEISVTADWGRVDAEQLRSTIDVMTQTGGALRCGVTRDGGAYSLGIYGDGPEPYTVYVRPNEDMTEILAELEQTFYMKLNATEKIIEATSPPTASEAPEEAQKRTKRQKDT